MRRNIDFFLHHSSIQHFLDSFYLQNTNPSHPLGSSWSHPTVSKYCCFNRMLQSFVLHHHLHLPGLYSSRAELICTSVSAEVCSFCVTSSAVFLVLLKTIIRLSSSARELLVLVSRNKRLSSRSLILLLFMVTSSIRSVLSFSNSCWNTQQYLEKGGVIKNENKKTQDNSF